MADLFLDYNFASGLALHNITLGDLRLKVFIEFDEKFLKMAQKGEESILLQKMHDAANKPLVALRTTIQTELKTIDGKFRALLDKDPHLLATTQNMLRAIIETQTKVVEDAVTKVWTDYRASRKAYSAFKFKCIRNYVLGAIAIAASVASLVASGGAAITGYLGIMKAVADIASTADNQFSSASDVADELEGRLIELYQNIDREKSTFRQVVTDLSPIFSKLSNSITVCDNNCKMLHGKIGDTAKSLNHLVAKLNEGLNKFYTVEKAFPQNAAELREIRMGNTRLITEVTQSNAALATLEKNHNIFRTNIDKLRKKVNPGAKNWTDASTGSKVIAGLATAAQSFASAAGHSLLAMI